MDNTVQTSETPRKQGFWQRLRAPGASPESLTASSKSARATIAIAAIPSAASLVWTAWSLVDMIPAPLPVGLAVGVVLDIALVSAVAIAWIAPSVAKPAKVVGWLIALLAAALVGYHAYTILPALAALGLIPLVAKGLWHLALNARLARAAAEAAREEADREAAQEQAQREAELSPALTLEQKKTIAERQRDAAYEKELATADREVDAAKKDTEHQRKLADIRLLGEQQRAMDEESAKVEIARQDLVRKVNASRPASFTLPPGDVPNDLSGLPVSPASPGASQVMGFGAAMGSDQRMSPGRPGGDPVVADPPLRELMAYLGAAGEGASVRGAAKELRVAPVTIRRWRDKAEEQGLDVSVLKRRSQ